MAGERNYEGWGVTPWGSGLQAGVDANLHLRSFPTEADDGHVVSAVGASWKKCDNWAFSHTEIWVSIGSETRFGSEPYLTTTRNYAMISPVPPGKEIYVKIKHIPWQPISTMGRS